MSLTLCVVEQQCQLLLARLINRHPNVHTCCLLANIPVDMFLNLMQNSRLFFLTFMTQWLQD